MSSHTFNTVYENPKLCNDCKKVLKTHNITNKKVLDNLENEVFMFI